MRKFLLSLLGYALLTSAALAQGVNVVPQVGVNQANIRAYTYTAAILKLVPEGTAASDFFCIDGSSSRKVHINRIELSGTGTIATVPVYLNHNLGLDTGTHAVAATYGPVPQPLNQLNPAATAATIAYNATGGNPTIGGTVTTLRTGILFIYPATAATVASADRLQWTFGTPSEDYNQRLDLAAGATTEQYCLNLGATNVTGVLEGYIEWTEE